MTAIFLDTVGLLALWDEADQWHTAAETAFAAVVTSRATLRTTTSVLLECGNAAARRPYRLAVNELRQTLAKRDDLIVPTQEDWMLAWAAYERGDASQAGIVDHISFVVMRRLGISQAFTNDEHFRAAGFETLF